jgi:hypothetical protein
MIKNAAIAISFMLVSLSLSAEDQTIVLGAGTDSCGK